METIGYCEGYDGIHEVSRIEYALVVGRDYINTKKRVES